MWDAFKRGFSMTGQKREIRKFPRLFLARDSENQRRLPGACAFIDSQEPLAIFDISYGGAALSLPADSEKYSKDQTVNVDFDFQNYGMVRMAAMIIRCDDRNLAVQFLDLEPQARLTIERFLHAKMAGRLIRLVNPKNYAPEQDFSLWFHGPNDSNIYLWLNQGLLTKASIEWNGEILYFENGILSKGESRTILKRLTEDYSYYVNYEAPHFSIGSDIKFVDRMMELLSQVEDERPIIQDLMRAIDESLKST